MPQKGKIEGYHRAKSMLPEIRQLITEAAISTDTNREALADELLIVIKKNYPKEVPPKKETITKIISRARNSKLSVLDEPWHLGIQGKLIDEGIPNFTAEAIEAILKVQNWLSKNLAQAKYDVHIKNKDFTNISLSKGIALIFHTLSIRQAKWIASLYRATGDDTPYLWWVSYYYTYQEILSTLSNTTFNTQSIDAVLCQGKKAFLNMIDDTKKSEIDKYGNTWIQAINTMAGYKPKGDDK